MIIVGALFSLLVPIATVVLIVVVIRRLTGREDGFGIDGDVIRRFFQYALLLGLFGVAGGGLATLLGGVTAGAELARAGGADLARGLTFTIIGLPLYLGLAAWSRRRIGDDPAEAGSFGLAFYVTVATLVSLVVSMVALYDLLAWLLGVDTDDGRSVSRLIVWGAMWAVHRLVERRIVPDANTRVHHLLGSAIGLGVLFTGLAWLLIELLDAMFAFSGEAFVNGGAATFLEPAIVAAVGALIWFVYWIRQAAGEDQSPLWVSYVLLVGVGGGLVTAIVAASTVVFDLLVWLVGDPATDTAAQHFEDLPAAIAVVIVGIAVWWYHHAVLDSTGPDERTEVRRVYEYLMAGVGLLAAAAGLTTVLVAFVEAITGRPDLEVGLSATNTLLAAATMLLVGGPLWGLYWGRIQRAETAMPEIEQESLTRRIYLFVLFGLGGVAAVIALLTGVFLFFEDLFEGRFGSETLRDVRFALGALTTTGAIAAYHWSVYRSDQQRAPSVPRGPRYVLLVGPADADITKTVGERTGGRVQAWPRRDGQGGPWSPDEVMESLAEVDDGEAVVVIADEHGLTAIPVDRG